jgi:predicted nucleic acid-binding protein
VNRKFKLSYADIEKAFKEIHNICDVVLITYETLLHALKIASKYKYSFPDSLIIATAIEQHCTILITEDMHDKQIIENSLTILNPF